MDLKKQQFAANMAMGMTQTAAARAAGYSAAMGSKLIQEESIGELVLQERQKIQSQLVISRNDILQGLLDVVEDAKLSGETMPRVAAWREIGKIVGVYAPEERKLTIEKDVTVIQKRVKELADEQLHEYALIEGEVVQEEAVNE